MSWNRDWGGPAKNIFEALKVKKGDRLAIIFNTVLPGKEYLVEALENLAKDSGIESVSIQAEMDESFKNEDIEEKLFKFFKGTEQNNRKIFFTTSRAHITPSRRNMHKLICQDPQKLGGYALSLPVDSAEIMYNLSYVSPTALLKRGKELKAILSKATGVRVTSKGGTDISFNWDSGKRNYLISAGFPDTHDDRWDNLGGEVYTAPLHKTVNGRLVIDGAIGGLGLVDDIIVVDIKNGVGTTNLGESKSKNVIDEFDSIMTSAPCASIVGEFGIGTTPNLKLTGELINDEKVEGTIHIAFGDSYAADGSGGENDCDSHMDCMVLSPTVNLTIDNKTVCLMKDGKFLM